MSDRDAVLFANEAFYRAFADRDMDAMREVWSTAAQVSCIHPGWGPIFGQEEVMASWLAILANPQSPDVACRAPRAAINTGTALVVCFEELDGQFLIASNVFIRERGLWRLQHHQAGPTSAVPAEEDDEMHMVN